MKIRTHLARGSQHKVYCEDFLVVSQQNDILLAAVFDGCSSGIQSHLASGILGNSVLHSFKNIHIDDSMDLESLSDQLIQSAFAKACQVFETLGMITDQQLSTALISLIYTKNARAIITIAGDGVVVINDEKHIIEQDNTPDYPAYHFKEVLAGAQSYNDWLKNHARRISAGNIFDMTISTDGINAFGFTGPKKNDISTLDYLAVDTFLAENQAMLSRKVNILNTMHNLAPLDDLGIIRIMF